MRRKPKATGSVTARPNRCRRWRWHRHCPGRCRDIAAAARLRTLVGGAGIRHRPTRTWRDVGAAARTQSWLRPGNRARRHRHGCRSRAGFEPLQFLSVELIGDIVAGRRSGRLCAVAGHSFRGGLVMSVRRPVGPGGSRVSGCRASRRGRRRPAGRRPGGWRLGQGRCRDRQGRSNGNTVQQILHAFVLRCGLGGGHVRLSLNPTVSVRASMVRPPVGSLNDLSPGIYPVLSGHHGRR